MNCPGARAQFLERLHRCELAAAEAAAIESHLAVCPACAAWSAQQTAFDRALAAECAPEALPAGWRAQLDLRVAAVEAEGARASLAERRRAMEREFAERLARVHGRFAPRAWSLSLIYGGSIALGCAAINSVLRSPLEAYPGAVAAVMCVVAGAIMALVWLGVREARRAFF